VVNVNVHTLSLEKADQRAIPRQHCVYLVPVLGEAAEHSLHATAGTIKVHRVVNGEDIHPESMPVNGRILLPDRFERLWGRSGEDRNDEAGYCCSTSSMKLQSIRAVQFAAMLQKGLNLIFRRTQIDRMLSLIKDLQDV
jgi:hypothetical protein